MQPWRLVPVRSLCFQAQLQLGHPLSLHMPPTLSLERGSPQIDPPQTGSLRQPTSSAAGWGRQTRKVAEREFLAVKKEGKARLLAWELT